MNNKYYQKLIFLILLITLSCNISRIEIENPYKNKKDFPYKASLHNHSKFHPEWSHAPIPSDKRLSDYRDYETYPKYGIVAITEHERLTLPSNTIPSGDLTDSSAPWGVKGILWIPGIETIIGHREKDSWDDNWRYEGDLFGEMLIINASGEQTEEIDWTIAKDNSAASGWIYTSRGLPPIIEFSFTGTGFNWIAKTDIEGGIAEVILNEKKIGEANLFSSKPIFKQVVFSISDLENKKHKLQIKYDRKGDSPVRFWAKINMDMITVIKPGGKLINYGANHSSITYLPFRYKHEAHPRGKGRSVEEPIRMLKEDGCFLVLSHPNSRLETTGESKGIQLWPSAGYTFHELDLIFGNQKKGILPMSHTPHAIEIGNQGYDFSDRTNFKNAEEKWDYLLKQGHRVMGTASDDSHGTSAFGGWIVVNTNAPSREDLELEDVMESLFSGNFYASQGPNIEIEVKKNKFTIKADKPALIEFISKEGVVKSENNQTLSTYVIKGDEEYVRGRVTREDSKWKEINGGGIGKKRSAWTNPIYVIKK